EPSEPAPNLAWVLKWYQFCLRGQERVLPPSHPDVLAPPRASKSLRSARVPLGATRASSIFLSLRRILFGFPRSFHDRLVGELPQTDSGLAVARGDRAGRPRARNSPLHSH